MPDELTFLNTLIAQLGSQGAIWGIIILFLWKKGILKSFFNGNGNNKEISELKEEIFILKENHITHLEEKLDKLIEKEIEGNLVAKEILIILKERHENK